MRLLRILRDRLRALLGRDIVAEEIRDEIQFHLDARATEHERRGLSALDARRLAIKKFGNPAVVRDRGYDVRGGGLMESLLQDLRFGVRLLWKAPGFSAVALLTLALGTGATTALFCVVDAALIRPLPYPKPEQLVYLDRAFQGPSHSHSSPSLTDMDDWATLTQVFSHVGSVRPDFRTLIDGPEPERVLASLVTADYLPMYGRTPFLGRGLTASDEPLGAPSVVVLGYRFWLSHFNGDRTVIGRPLRFADESPTIIGVLPDDHSPQQVPFWLPLQVTAERRRAPQYSVWGRLRDGVTVEQAQGAISALASSREDNVKRKIGACVLPAYDAATRGVRPTVNVLLGAVGFVLLIACVNVASLQLARGATRETELAVRASMGAGRGRLVRQLLTESLLLGLAGSALGIGLAWLLLSALVANIPVRMSTDVRVALNGWVLGAAVGVAIVSGMLFGLAPALKLSRMDLTAALGRGSRGIRSTLSNALSRTLVTVEVASAVLLVAGAALMIESFVRLSAFDLGFDPTSFTTLDVQPVDTNPATFATYDPSLLDRVRALPGVAAAGATPFPPLNRGNSFTNVRIDGPAGNEVGVSMQQVTPGYFEALALPLQAGRFARASDIGGAPWMLLSERAATEMFPGTSAIGRYVENDTVWCEVIGVVGNVWANGPERAPDAHVYVAYDAGWNARVALAGRATGMPMAVVVRPADGASVSAAALRQAARAVGPPVIVGRVRSGGELWSEVEATPRQRTVLLGILGGLGLLLALVGIYGVTSFTISRRTAEAGIRMACGAQPGQVVRTMVKDASLPIAAGLAIGLAAAYYLTSVIATFLFKTTPHDPLAFMAVAAALAASGTIAAWIPARRAGKIDPVVALRAD